MLVEGGQSELFPFLKQSCSKSVTTERVSVILSLRKLTYKHDLYTV